VDPVGDRPADVGLDPAPTPAPGPAAHAEHGEHDDRDQREEEGVKEDRVHKSKHQHDHYERGHKTQD